jgi:hypothetical protein
MKYVETSYGNRKNILAFTDHYVAVPVMVDSTDAAIVASEGKKILPAGTIIGGGFLSSLTAKAVTKNDTNAEAVLLYDVDVTYGDAPGAAVIHGFISKSKLPTVPDAAAITALKSRITFLV